MRTRELQPMGKHDRMSRLKDYTILEKLGQGTFGVVQKARNQKGEMVAVKQLLNHSAKEGFPITAMREITILKGLDHKNILKIVDMVYDDPKVSSPAELVTTRGCFYTVTPYISSDLVGLLENPKVSFELIHIRRIMKQLLEGVDFIHQQRFLHRDIKAANILLDKSGVLKIADFGLARTYHGKPPKLGTGPGGGERAYTGLVMTRWYRAPELLLGETKYTTAVDMWGVGCVFGELFTQKPILVGKSDAHQAQLVFQLCGPPTDWAGAIKLPNTTGYNAGLTCKRTLETRFGTMMPNDGIELLSSLLRLDPYKRLTAQDALAHPFFKDIVDATDLPQWEECHEIDKERFKKMARESPGVTSYKPLHPAPSSTFRAHMPLPRGPASMATPPFKSQATRSATPETPKPSSPGVFMNRKRRPTGPASTMKRERVDKEVKTEKKVGGSNNEEVKKKTTEKDVESDVDLSDDDAMAKILEG